MITETQWRAQVVDLATTLGWRVYYVENSTREIIRRSGRRIRVRNVNIAGVGFPDLVLVRRRDGRLGFVELKRDRGPRGGGQHEHVETTDAQNGWLEDLGAVATACRNVVHLAQLNQAEALSALEYVPRLFVAIWRPSDLERVKEILR